MDLLGGAADLIRLLVEGGDLRDKPRALMLVSVLAALVPASLIALGIGMTEWRETPLAQFFGWRSPPVDDWATRARDIDKDGTPDF